MVTTRILILVLCLIPTIVFSGNLEVCSLKDYKKGILQMVLAGNQLKDKDQNKALAVYRAEYERIASLEGSDPKQLFPESIYQRMQEIDQEVGTLRSAEIIKFKQAIPILTSETFNDPRFKEFNTLMTITIMQSLKRRGVAFAQKLGNAEFLEVNANISPEATSYLIPTAYFCYFDPGRTQELEQEELRIYQTQQDRTLKRKAASSTAKAEENKCSLS